MSDDPRNDLFNRPRSQLSVWERADLRAEDRRRMSQNIAAGLFVVALVCAGMWVIDGVMAYSKSMSCLQYRHKVCR